MVILNVNKWVLEYRNEWETYTEKMQEKRLFTVLVTYEPRDTWSLRPAKETTERSNNRHSVIHVRTRNEELVKRSIVMYRLTWKAQIIVLHCYSVWLQRWSGLYQLRTKLHNKNDTSIQSNRYIINIRTTLKLKQWKG